jgi:hypothetical protein
MAYTHKSTVKTCRPLLQQLPACLQPAAAAAAASL